MNKSETLYKIDSKGKTRVFYYVHDNTSYTTYAGLEDGKLTARTTEPKPKGKNTLAEQVIKEAQAKWRKKFERELYSTDLSKPHPLAFTQPMLARDYTKVGHQLVWEKNTYVAQRKLNGVRCTASYDGSNVLLISKKGKKYSVPRVEESLYDQVYKHPELTSIVTDGELYIHGVDVGDVAHAIANAEEFPNLEYHIFDIVNEDMTYKFRFKMLSEMGFKFPLYNVPIVPIQSEAEMIKAHDQFVQQGYEGVMIRDYMGLYEKGSRSLGLFKRKTFKDSEFKVVGTEQDKDGGAVLILETTTGVRFNSRPMGSNQLRSNLWEQRTTLIGKMVTVKYSNLLATGAPEFNRTLPRGIIRDYE